jgi:hypothetical protein
MSSGKMPARKLRESAAIQFVTSRRKSIRWRF